MVLEIDFGKTNKRTHVLFFQIYVQ